MPPTPARKKPTYADLAAVPVHKVAEIVAGTLVTTPRPAPRHAAAASSVGAQLWSGFQRGNGGPGGWWILDEPELHLLTEQVLVPDIAGWTIERLPELPTTAWFDLPPDWVCEVVSPSTEAFDRAEKMPVYARAGVGHLWLVDPDVKTLEVFARSGVHWPPLATHRGDVEVQAPPFEAAPLDLAAVWGPPPATAGER